MLALTNVVLLCSLLASIGLVHGAEQGSCMHKKDFRFFQNPPIETPALREAIERYDKLHAEAEQRQGVKEAFESKDKASIQNKYIYVEMSTSGLGNRFMAMVSSYLLALLTDRVLIIHSTSFDISTVICTPFSESSIFLPEGTDLEAVQQGDKHLLIDGSYSGKFNEMAKRDMEAAYGDKPIWKLHEVEQYFMPALFANPVYADTLKKWFPSRNVATKLMRYLLHPADEVWIDILDTISQKDTMDYTVGLQLRQWINMGNALACFEHDLKPDHTHMFVASLMNVESMLHAKNEKWHVTQKYKEGHEEHANAQTQHAMHDMWVMSLTDETVVSSHSTFGYIVMAIKGEICLMADENQNSHCYYPQSHEPCWHLAGKIGFKYEDTPYAGMFSPCEDFEGGVKLSD